MRSASTLVLVALGALSCSTSTTDTTTTTVVTSLVVTPGAFLGSTPCSAAPGGLRSYVATLVDLSASPSGPSSSLPTSCAQKVAFLGVTVGKRYSVTIAGYEEPAGALTPLGGPSSGASAMLVRASGASAAPRWTTTCARDGLEALGNQALELGGCEPLTLNGAAPVTAVRVDPRATLGNLACVGAPQGTVSRFTVRPVNPALPVRSGLPCASGLAEFAEGIEAGAHYGFYVDALSEGAAPTTLRAACSVTARAGVTTTASCTPLAAAAAP